MWSNRYTGPGILKMDVYGEAVVSCLGFYFLGSKLLCWFVIFQSISR